MKNENSKIILKKGEENRIKEGHPWVFSNEILRFEGNIKSGNICDVYSINNEFIGRGFLNTSSKIMVRILTHQQEEIDENFFFKRIEQAWEYRKSLGLENNCRVVFSEADFLPGLIVDKYGDYLSIQILSLGMEIRKEMIINLLVKILNPKGIYERSDVSVRKKEGLEEFKGFVYKEFNPLIEIEENGVKLIVDVANGQKTGYFLDQKMNRAAIKPYVKNKVVLDCFSHTGSFGLHSAKFGAQKVVCVDISQKACEDIEKNIKLNGFDNMEVVCDDVFDYLRKAENNQKFDVIILDPPAFTKTKDTVEKAYRGYKEINLQAMKMIKKGGFIITFSCSQHMVPALFLEMLADASKDSKRNVRMIDFKIQAPDHPTLLNSEESLYLKCVVLNIL